MNSKTRQRPRILLTILLAASLAVSGTAIAGVSLHKSSAQPQAETLPARAVNAAYAADSKALPVPVLTAAAVTAEGGNVALRLYRGHAEDTTQFQAGNMFPGDAESREYRLEVSYKGSVTVHFRADVRKGYEKLAEVLKCRVSLGGVQLYDGLMRDMPESLSRALPQSRGTTANLYYDITVYLDTSVGNEYMGKELYADFRWWVDEASSPNAPAKPGGLIYPKTGDESRVFLWASLAGLSLALPLALLFVRRRKKEDDHEQR